MVYLKIVEKFRTSSYIIDTGTVVDTILFHMTSAKLRHEKWNYNSVSCYNRYRREIPEPALFLSWHGAQIGGLWVFPIIKILVGFIRHLHLLVSEHEDKYVQNAAWHAKIMDAFILHLFLGVWSTKTQRPPI